jgi:hypothetical protein
MAAEITGSADMRWDQFWRWIHLDRFVGELAGLNLDPYGIEMRCDAGLEARFAAFGVTDASELPDKFPGRPARGT